MSQELWKPELLNKEQRSPIIDAGAAVHTPPGSPWHQRMLLGAFVLLFALYVRVIGFAPVYDDNIIGEWGKLSDIPKFFTHDIFGSDGAAHSVYYRPLAVTYGFLLSYCTGGLPGWMHLGAIALLLCAFWLAYRLGCRLFGDERLALLTALLFALHPSKVESTAWIGSSCVDALSGVFFFAALIAFMNSREESDWLRWRGASIALFACALLTKETMVVIPAILAVMLWTSLPPGGRLLRTIKALLPYGAVAAVYLAVRHQVIRPPKADATYIHPTFTHSYLWTAPHAFWWYLRHLLWPAGLAVEYENFVLETPTPRAFWLPAVGALLLLAIALWFWRRNRSPLALALGCWFLLAIAPAVAVAAMVGEHDRYLYLASYPFCALIAWMILRAGRLHRRARLAVALGVIVLFSGLTWHEMSYWDCDLSLWSRAYQISPKLVKAELLLASEYAQAGDTGKAFAISDQGLRYHPLSPNLWLQRAGLLQGQDKLDEARAAYVKVLEITDPASDPALDPGQRARLRSAAAFQLAKMALAAGSFIEAERYVRMAIAINFDGPAYHTILAESLRGQGRIDEADAESRLELRLRLAKAAR